MRNVMLATPAYDGRLDVSYTHSLMQSIALCARHDIALHPVWWPGEALVQHARNMLVALALEAKVDDVLFVDADQSWLPEQALRLLSHRVDIVGAPVRKKSDLEQYNVRVTAGEFPVHPATGLWLVSAVGTGFLRVSRNALQAVWDTSEPYSKAGQKCRMIFDVPVINGELWGEDTIFCEKLKQSHQIYIDPTFVVAHHGTKVYTGDFQDYIRRLRGQRPALNVVA